MKKEFCVINNGTLFICNFANKFMVNLTTTQVETLFGELEYIEPLLRVLGVADEEIDRV